MNYAAWVVHLKFSPSAGLRGSAHLWRGPGYVTFILYLLYLASCRDSFGTRCQFFLKSNSEVRYYGMFGLDFLRSSYDECSFFARALPWSILSLPRAPQHQFPAAWYWYRNRKLDASHTMTGIDSFWMTRPSDTTIPQCLGQTFPEALIRSRSLMIPPIIISIACWRLSWLTRKSQGSVSMQK